MATSPGLSALPTPVSALRPSCAYTKLFVLPGSARVTALYKTVSSSRSLCLPGLRNGALPHFSILGCLLFHRHLRVPGAARGHTPLSAFQHVALGAGPCLQHWKACGGRGVPGSSCLVQSDHLSGQASAARKVCINVMNFAGMLRKSTNASLALKITSQPGCWLASGSRMPAKEHSGVTALDGSVPAILPVHEALPCPSVPVISCTVQGKKFAQSPPGENHPAFQLAV